MQISMKQINSKYTEIIYNLNQNIFKNEITYTKDFIASFCKNKSGFVLHDGQKYVGYILFLFSKTIVTIASLGVIKSEQKKGYGQLLLKKVIELFGEKYNIDLDVRMSNKRAQNLYKKNGFEAKYLKENYYWQLKEDAIYMIRCSK